MPAVHDYANVDLLLDDVRARLNESMERAGDQKPRVIVIGAKGRCGTGALDLLKAAGIPQERLLEWDMDETAPGGPFKEIVESDIFVNCIYLMEKIPPFVDMPSLETAEKEGRRKLSVVCDVCILFFLSLSIAFLSCPTVSDSLVFVAFFSPSSSLLVGFTPRCFFPSTQPALLTMNE